MGIVSSVQSPLASESRIQEAQLLLASMMTPNGGCRKTRSKRRQRSAPPVRAVAAEVELNASCKPNPNRNDSSFTIAECLTRRRSLSCEPDTADAQEVAVTLQPLNGRMPQFPPAKHESPTRNANTCAGSLGEDEISSCAKA